MWRLSTGFRSALLETKSRPLTVKTATTISFANNTISDSGSGLTGFNAGDTITVIGSANPANVTTRNVISAAAGSVVVDGAVFTTELAGTSITLISTVGGCVKDLLKNGVIKIFSGSQPLTADDAETGTLLCTITKASGPFVPGAAANGLVLGDTVGTNAIHKLSTDIWSGVNANTAAAGWFRFYANDATAGASTTAIRVDGTVANSGGQMNVSSTSLVSGVTTTVDAVSISIPTA